MARERFDFIVRLRDRFTSGLRRLRKETKDVLVTLGKFTGVGAAVTAAFGAISGVRIFSAGLSSAIEFEEQLKRVQSVSGATSEEFDKLASTANALGANTRFTATEAAQGLEELVRAGQSAGEAIETIGSALNVAQANTIEVADAATLVTTTLNQFQLAAGDASRAADLLTRGTQVSAQNIEQLGNALEFAGPQAKQAGLSLEETIAVIGRLADVGFRGEKGGTALRNALIELQDPSSNFRQELRELGISSTDFLDVLDQLAEKGSASESALLALGKRAGPAISTLVTQGTGDLQQLITTLNDASGTAARTAAEMDNNLSGALKGLGSAFDAFARAAVQPILKPLTDGVRETTLRLRELANSPAFERATKRFGELVSRGIEVFGNFIESINFDTLFDRIAEFVSKATSALSDFGKSTRAVTNGIANTLDYLTAGFNTLRGAVELVVGGVAKAVQTVVSLLTRVLSFVDVLGGLKDQIAAIGRIGEAAGAVAESAFARAAESGERIVDAVENLQRRSESAKRSVDDLGESLGDIESQGQAAARGVDAFSKSAADAQPELELLESTTAAARERLEELAEAEDKAAGAAQAKRFNQLVASLAELQRQGKGSTDQAKALQRELQSFSRQMDRSSGDVGDLSEEFKILKTTSADALKNAAEQAEAAFDRIVRASQRGTASQQDVRNAFQGLADAYRASAEGADEATQKQVEAQLQAKSAAAGVADEYQRQGEEAGEAGRKGADGGKQVSDSFSDAADSASDAADQVERVGEESKRTASSAAAAIGSIIAGYNALGERVAGEVSNILERISVQGQSVGDFLRKLGTELRILQSTLKENQEAADQALEDFNSGVDELGNGLRKVASDFKLLDDQTLDKLNDALIKARKNVEDFRGELTNSLQEAQDQLTELEGGTVDREARATQNRIKELRELLVKNVTDPRIRKQIQDELNIQIKIAAAQERRAAAAASEAASREKNARLAEREKANPRKAQVSVILRDDTDPNARRLRLSEEDKAALAQEVVRQAGLQQLVSTDG